METAGLHSKTLHRRVVSAHCARNPCSGVFGSHWALEITVGQTPTPFRVQNRCSSWLLFLRQHLKTLHRTSAAFSHIAVEITARACSAPTGRSKAWLGRASKPLSARNRCSSKRLCFRQHFRVPFEILFEMALLRTVHCFELCFVATCESDICVDINTEKA